MHATWFGRSFLTAASRCLVLLACAFWLTSPSPAQACEMKTIAQEASLATIRAYVRGQHRDVLTFAGYSGAGYEDAAAMLEQAGSVLDAHDPKKTLVNIGATAEGIGAVYELAKRKGFATIGIVSTLARDEKVPLSPCVDRVFFVADTTWGGRLPDSEKLSPTSTAMVAVSTEMVSIGGGDVARDEMLMAKKAGKKVRFIAADMNHRAALEKAQKKGTPAPTDFRGTAHPALAEGEPR